MLKSLRSLDESALVIFLLSGGGSAMAEKPLDEETLAAAARETGALVVAEEHLVDCGLGARVAQALARRAPAPVEFIGLETYAESGTPEGVPAKYGLTSQNAVAAARRAMARKAS